MKNSLFLLLIGLCVCYGNDGKVMNGMWIEQSPHGMNRMQGFMLSDIGVAESLGTGEMVCNDCNADTLVRKRENADVRRDNDKGILKSSPSREAYEGFVWKVLSGAGLALWVQENENIRFLSDASLPGIVMARNGDKAPHTVIQVFDLPNKNINDVIRTLEKTANWDKSQTAKFEEAKSGREGVVRYVMIPDGSYAAEIESQMESGPVPAPCNGWGSGNSGRRYFEIFDSHPDKAVFVETGQDVPLFDENSIVFSCMGPEGDGMTENELFTLEGTVIIGHEVRSFKPCGSDGEYWIVDKTGTLNDIYDSVTNGHKNGMPVEAVLKVEYVGRWTDGFAADYSGVFFVREVVNMD